MGGTNGYQELERLHASTKEGLLAWMDQFENDHYVLDVYGETVTVDLPRQTVEAVLDISLLLLDRVVEAHGDLATAEYEALERKVLDEYSQDGAWLLHVMLEAVGNDRLFGRYRDIASMIGKLEPRGYPIGSAPYLLLVLPEIHKLIYAVIRHADDAQENYLSLTYTFFIGVLTKCWGEGFGWSKTETGGWMWSKNADEKSDPEKGCNMRDCDA